MLSKPRFEINFKKWYNYFNDFIENEIKKSKKKVQLPVAKLVS